MKHLNAGFQILINLFSYQRQVVIISWQTIQMLEQGKIDVAQAEAMTNITQGIIVPAKVEVDFINAVGGISTGTGFIPPGAEET